MRIAVNCVAVGLLAVSFFLVGPPGTTNLAAASSSTAPVASNIAVHFSPKGGCTDAVVAELNAAKQTIDVQAYSFTSTPIAKAVKKAFERGVKVRVILDKSQRTEKYSSATYLYNAKVPVWIDSKHAIAHNKIMLIDGKTILTGSFNFTTAAEDSNAENLLVIRGEPKLYAAYADNFAKHLGHSEKYNGLGKI